MKKVFLIITFCMALTNAKEIEVNLLDFANLASENSKTDILLSDEIEPNNYYFYTSKNSEIKIGHFRKAIESKGLKLILTDDFYYVVPKNDENVTFTDKKLRYLPLENNSFNDISGIISARIDTNTTYISSTNSAVFMADDEEYSEILEFSKMADKKLEQVNFKLTILETNTNDYRDLGTHINSLGDLVTHSDLNYFINLITMPFTAETNIITNKKKGFYGVLSLLEQNGVTTIKQSPFLVAKSGKEVYFSSVENIPYLRNTSSYSNNGTTTQTTYDYKDVGLKIKIRPVVLENMVGFQNIHYGADIAPLDIGAQYPFGMRVGARGQFYAGEKFFIQPYVFRADKIGLAKVAVGVLLFVQVIPADALKRKGVVHRGDFGAVRHQIVVKMMRRAVVQAAAVGQQKQFFAVFRAPRLDAADIGKIAVVLAL